MHRGWAWGGLGLAVGLGLAWSGAEAQTPPERERLQCRTFLGTADDLVDTQAPATDVGRWVLDQEGKGWQTESVEFSMLARPSGAIVRYVHVCLSPIRG